MKSVAIYARVSSEQQTQQATVESQVAALKERAAADGHVLVPDEVYVDDGYSGSTLRRPALERLRDRAAEGTLDVLYVLSPDRLARRYAYQVLLLDELASYDVEVVFLQGRSGETPEDQLLLQVQGVIAEYERAKILERSRRGKVHQARRGLVNCLSNAPFGYRYVKKTDAGPASYQIVLHEAKVVRWIFDAVVREQRSLRQITRMLNDEHAPTPRGGARWNAAHMQRILGNPAYMGKAAFGRRESIHRAPRLRPLRNRGPIPRNVKTAKRLRPKEEWIYIDVPAIVSPEVFEAAQEQLERNQRFAQRNARAHRYLLQGLTVCARCRYGYQGKSVSRKPRDEVKLLYYRCNGRNNDNFGGNGVCDNTPVRADLLEQHVWQSVCELLQDPQRLKDEWSRRSASGTDKLEQQRHDALRVVRAHERSLQRLVDAYEAGVLKLDELKTRTDQMRSRLESARGDVDTFDRMIHDAHELKAVVTRLEDFAKRVRDGLDALSWSDRQQLVRTLVARIEIDHDTVTIVYRVSADAPGSPPAPRGPSSGRRPPGASCGSPTTAQNAKNSSISPSNGPTEIVDCVTPALGRFAACAFSTPSKSVLCVMKASPWR